LDPGKRSQPGAHHTSKQDILLIVEPVVIAPLQARWQAVKAEALALVEAARELVEKRDAWLNPPDASAEELKRRTLTNLYNARPSWLVEAHRKLDAAVFAAYGWPVTLTDAELLERLLALNHERGQHTLPKV